MGDTVRLTIGGPLMSILSATQTDCCCMWFADSGQFQHGTFELHAIELVERPPRLIHAREPGGGWGGWRGHRQHTQQRGA